MTDYLPPWPQRRLLDDLTRRYTAIASFDELVSNPHGYRPTLHAWRSSDRLGIAALRAAYDTTQARRGDPRRAWPTTTTSRFRA
ncbi:MAG: hypothetical protein IT340_19890 [Chloroflexi bacterium]|nr:hypothetical protein [Chloroflexota bacterium]